MIIAIGLSGEIAGGNTVQAIEKATKEFEAYRRKEMLQYESDFDRALRELKAQAGNIETEKDDESTYRGKILETRLRITPQKNRLSVMKAGFCSIVAETGLEPVTFGL